MKLFIIILILSLIHYSCHYQNTTVCADTQYFDTVSMDCLDCPTGTTRSPYSDMKCIC